MYLDVSQNPNQWQKEQSVTQDPEPRNGKKVKNQDRKKKELCKRILVFLLDFFLKQST